VEYDKVIVGKRMYAGIKCSVVVMGGEQEMARPACVVVGDKDAQVRR